MNDAMELSETDRIILTRLLEARAEIARWTLVKEECERDLKANFADAAVGTVAGNEVLHYAPVVSRVLDQKALKEDHPDLVAHYMTERETRPFRISDKALEGL